MDLSSTDLKDLIALAETKVVLSMAITMYFRLSMFSCHDGVARCLEEFLERCEPHLKWYADEEIGRFRKVKPQLLRYPIKRISDEEGAKTVFSWIMHGGEKYEYPSSWEFEGWSTPYYDSLSFVRVTFPVQWYLDDPLSFVRLVKGWADRLPIVHGYGGFAFNQSATKNQPNSPYVFAIAQRFSGVEVEDLLGTAMCCVDCIKGVNWLTLLAPEFVSRLGGEDNLRARFSSDIYLYPIATGGLIIQAGDKPGLGDVNAEERLSAYREVARVLKPIRATTHPSLGPAEYKSFGKTDTEQWLRRFDD